MANPEQNGEAKSRGTGSFKGARAIANRGISAPKRPERNVPAGNFFGDESGYRFKAIGLDISSTDFSKTGVGSDFGKVASAYAKAPGAEVIVRGLVSPSVQPGSNPADLEYRRAASAKALLVRQGIPANSIRIEAAPSFKLDPRSISPEQRAAISREEKAARRGATIEIVPPKTKIMRNEIGFTDDSVLVEGKKRWEKECPNSPGFPNSRYILVRRFIWPQSETPSNEDRKDKPDPRMPFLLREIGKGAGRALITWAVATGVLGLATAVKDLKELEKLADEVFEQRVQDRGRRDDNKDRKEFIDLVVRRIKMDATHPLRKLIDPNTGKLRGPRILYSLQTTFDAGDTINAHSGVSPHYALELTIDNRGLMRGERLGVIFFKPAKLIGGIPVELKSAVYLEKVGIIPKGTLNESPLTLGWSPRGGRVFK